MSDRESRFDAERGGRQGPPRHDDTPSSGDREHRTWAEGDFRDHRGRGQDGPYGRLGSGVDTGSGGRFSGGGYGDQGGFGSQEGQGGYASPAQGSRYGQTGSEWGRSGYGSFSGEGSGRGRSYGGGRSEGFGATTYGGERDDQRPRDRGHDPRNQGGDAPWGGRHAFGEGGYSGGASPDPKAGGTYGQGDYGRSAQRSAYRGTPSYDSSHADARGGFGASGRDDDDHEPHYRTWREQQLAGHDRDYDRWRTAQSKRYDEEYKRYRDQRHEGFSRDFGDWRSKAGQETGQAEASAQASPGSGPQTSGAQTSGGQGHGSSAASAGSSPTSGAQAAGVGTAPPLAASDESLRSVTDGHAGKAADHGKADEKNGAQAS